MFYQSSKQETVDILKYYVKYNIFTMIYTSSMDVCYSGQDIFNGNEYDTTIADKFAKRYDETIGTAAQLVIKYNNKKFVDINNENRLQTCAIRARHVFGYLDFADTKLLLDSMYFQQNMEKIYSGNSINNMTKDKSELSSKHITVASSMSMVCNGNVACVHVLSPCQISKVNGKSFFIKEFDSNFGILMKNSFEKKQNYDQFIFQQSHLYLFVLVYCQYFC